MKNLKLYEEWNLFNRKKKEPEIEYKTENGIQFMRNPSGGDWINIGGIEEEEPEGPQEEEEDEPQEEEMTAEDLDLDLSLDGYVSLKDLQILVDNNTLNDKFFIKHLMLTFKDYGYNTKDVNNEMTQPKNKIKISTLVDIMYKINNIKNDLPFVYVDELFDKLYELGYHKNH